MLGHRRVSDAIKMAATKETDDTKTGDQYTPGMFCIGVLGLCAHLFEGCIPYLDLAGPCREVAKVKGWINLELDVVA